MVAELPRLPGARENRWAHLLSGAPVAEAPAAGSGNDDVSFREVAALKANVARLEGDVAMLKDLVGRICADLGIPATPA